tara:strand:+ start:720 stop:1028 length:309 start_codon:yes stop_codon:yes gene_type:complete
MINLDNNIFYNRKPKINEEDEVILMTDMGQEHELILFNDDVNTFDHVIETLVSVCNHTYEQAEQCAYIVHFSGKCSVKKGKFSYLEPLCLKLLQADLSAEIS